MSYTFADAECPSRTYTALLVVRTRRSVSTRFVYIKYFRLRTGFFVQELKLIGEFGLKNKREVWRVKYTLAKIRKAARELLTLEEKVTISNSLPVSVSCF